MMKMSLISKIIISNLSVLAISLISLFVVYDFAYEQNRDISLHRNYVNQFDKEIILVASNLYRSAQIGDDKYLSQAAVSSKRAIYLLDFFERHDIDTKKLRENYIDFFKNAVIATSISLEKRSVEAKNADEVSLQKYELLQKEITTLLHLLDEHEEKLEKNIMLVISLFSLVFIFLILGNIFYIIKSYKHIQVAELKAAKQEHDSMMQRATMIDAIGDGVYGVDRDGMCTFVNQSAINLLGFSKDEILNTHQHDLFHHHKHDNSAYPHEECPIYITIRDREIKELEEYFIKKDGTFFPVNLTVAPTNDGGAIVVFRDITENNMILDSLKEAKEKAELASKAKSQFLANMSHEIRTPMNAVIVLSELLFDTKLDEKQHDLLLKISGSSKILLGIINDILDYSKIEAGKLELEHSKFQLEAVLERIKFIFLESALKKSLRIECKIQDDVPSIITGDELRITQVLTNLVSNAIKFTHEGRVELLVKLNKKIDENRVIVSFCVNDTGIGMSEKQLQKLFTPFTQADSSTTRKYGGTGLGLTISKKILEAMGSTLHVESKEGSGTTFSFEIEFEVASWQKSQPFFVAKKERTKKFENIRVLLAEDNLINQEVASLILKRVNIEVDIANNGKEAVEKYLANPSKYNIILMDLQMPIMSGYEATKLIREHDTKIPIIALTAAAMIEDRQKAMDAGMNEHLGKPIDINELYTTISNFCEVDFEPESPLLEPMQADKILDIEYLEKNFTPKESLMALLDNFLSELDTTFADIAVCVEEKKDKAQTLIHTLKGMSGNIRANLLYHAAKEIDKKYKLNEPILHSDIQRLKNALLSTKTVIYELCLNEKKCALQHPNLTDQEARELFYDIKQSILKSDMLEFPEVQRLFMHLSASINPQELLEAKRFIEDLEYDKALEIMNRWEL